MRFIVFSDVDGYFVLVSRDDCWFNIFLSFLYITRVDITYPYSTGLVVVAVLLQHTTLTCYLTR